MGLKDYFFLFFALHYNAIKSDQNGIERSLSHPQTGQRLISMIKSDQNGIESFLSDSIQYSIKSR